MSAELQDSGLKRYDMHECSQLNELKMDTQGMNVIAGWHLSGDVIMVEQMPIFGGYAGGIEETAICDVATSIASFALFDSDIHLDGPIHVRWGVTTARETLQIAAHVAAALDSNTDLLLANQYYTAAGPCTEMCLLEVAAQAITDTASGRELLSGPATAKGVSEDRTTGLESRMLGEASMATCGMEIPYVNRILDNIVSRYEKGFYTAPMGKKFQECYNLKDMTPTDQYLSVYDRTLNVLSECGIDF